MRTKYMTLCATLAVALLGAGCGGGGSSGGDTPPVTKFKLTVTKGGNGTGTVTGAGIDCGTTCSVDVASGTTVTLTSAPTTADNSTVGGFTGACTTASKICKVTVTADTAVTANFFGPGLTLATAGHGGGSVAIANTGGLKCGIGCTAFSNGTVVTLSATPTPDSRFTGWTGCTSSDTTCQVTLDAAKSVTAAFAFNGPKDDGHGGQVCYLPSEFSWTSTGPLDEPASGYVSLKDFTNVVYNNKHLVYASDVKPTGPSTGEYGAAAIYFDDWTTMKDVTPKQTIKVVAPTLFYFAPKDTWVLAYQWGQTGTFSYRTTKTPDDPTSWSTTERALYTDQLPTAEAKWGVIDQTFICDSTNCYLFFAGDNGRIYRSSMPIGDFLDETKSYPSFPKATNILTATSSADLFEAVQVYAIKGTNQYLMIVECQRDGDTRYFRALTATSLGGEWTPLTGLVNASESRPFANVTNVDFGDGIGKPGWTNDISHGDLVRDNPDQTFTVDACKLQLLYQGVPPALKSAAAGYDLIPWRPAVLTQVRTPDP